MTQSYPLIRDRIWGSKEMFLVNYLYFEIRNAEKGKITYKHVWVPNKVISRENIRLLTECVKVRWEIEHEHNNVLKNRGTTWSIICCMGKTISRGKTWP
jgi:hypothetical protein